MGVCKLCGVNGKLVDAHIIPKAFHRHMQTDRNRPLTTVATKSNEPPKRNPGGLYDREMLCELCEPRFGDWDQYGAECLIQRFEQDAVPIVLSNGNVTAYQIDKWDEKKLRMFALSVLWRAAVTSHKRFESVSLGPHEPRLRQLILDGDPGSPYDFAVTYSRWRSVSGNEQWTRAQMDPVRFKVEGVNTVHMFFGGGIVGIKCDQRPVPAGWREAVLTPHGPVKFVSLAFETNPFFGILMDGRRRLASKAR
jgi:hypothetical protein